MNTKLHYNVRGLAEIHVEGLSNEGITRYNSCSVHVPTFIVRVDMNNPSEIIIGKGGRETGFNMREAED